MIRVHVRNFQSIAQSTVEIDGFTVVTGPNNSGKTALMRAVRGVFTNAKGTSFVRHGTNNCEVTVELPDGNTVTWEKGASTNRYTVNGKTLDKVGQGVPDEVEALGIVAIQAGSQTVWPQIAQQFTGQVFLLDQAGSVVAEALADVERVGKLSRALKACDSDKRAATTELKVRRADAKLIATEVATFDGLDTALAAVANLEQDVTTLQGQRARIDTLFAVRDRMQSCRDKLAKLDGVQDVKVPTADAAAEVAKLGAKLASLTALEARWRAAKKVQVRLDGVQDVTCPAASEVQAIQDTRQQLADLQGLHGRYGKAKKVQDRLVGFEAPDLDVGKTDRVRAALDVMRRLKAQRDACLLDLSGLGTSLQTAQADLATGQAAVAELVAAMPACPTCGHTGHQC